jgi:ribosome biogenesis GTPase
MGKKRRKTRAEFRKNRSNRARPGDWTRKFQEHGFEEEAPVQAERISGKGELTRRRTVIGRQTEEGDQPGFGLRLEVEDAV